jgi:hypothetical protein
MGVRDVLLNLRDRIELGLYAADTPAIVAEELVMAGALFARTVEALPAGYDERPIFYGRPVATTRTLLWVAAQALHECEHHLADAEAGIAAIATTS